MMEERHRGERFRMEKKRQEVEAVLQQTRVMVEEEKARFLKAMEDFKALESEKSIISEACV